MEAWCDLLLYTCQAFRKRQNIRLRESKEDVLGYFRQVLTETSKCATSIELRTIFRDVSEKLSDLGLSLGGSEDWADRLYIEDRKGGLLFSDEELDTAEEAQKRMEVMYNVDAWTSQLASRINSAQLLLEVRHAMPHEELLQKALRRVEEDLRYHTELMDDPSSQFILSRIGDLGLPCEVAALADELLVKLAALFSLAVHELSTIVSTCAQIKIKAMRGAAAAKVELTTQPLYPNHNLQMIMIRSSLSRDRLSLIIATVFSRLFDRVQLLFSMLTAGRTPMTR